MAASDALSVDDAVTAVGAEAASGSSAASRRLPRMIPVAQLVAVVVGVLTIIWNQQQTTDSLRAELRDEIAGVEISLRDEMGKLRDEVSENGQRLARIEGFLGIGVPGDGLDTPPDERGPSKPATAATPR